MKNKFADLHSHPHGRLFIRCVHTLMDKSISTEEKTKLLQTIYNPWTIIASPKDAKVKGQRAFLYGQGDLVKFWNAGVRITFNALYPMEKGFFQRPKTTSAGRKPLKIWKDLLWLLTNEDDDFRDLLQQAMMRLPFGSINYLQSDDYDYWESLKAEYSLAVAKTGVWSSSQIRSPLLKKDKPFINKLQQKYPESFIVQTQNQQGIYKIPKTKVELNQFLLDNELHTSASIVMLLTIEGGHALGADKLDWDCPEMAEKALIDRVNELKSWDYPIFFMTLAHHFYNYLCGHARSFPDISNLVANQDQKMYTGFSKAGYAVVQRLLCLDKNNRKVKNSPKDYRILLDIRHMSAQSRKDYYTIINDCLQEGDNIPVISSHSAYSGLATLQELIKNQKRELCERKDRNCKNEGQNYLEPSQDIANSFCAWSINLCNEDIEIIAKTNGLIGIIIEQRLLGVPPKNYPLGGTRASIKQQTEAKNGIPAIWNNIKAIVEVIAKFYQELGRPPIQAWDRVCLGGDFDGFIDPIDDYPTALDLDDLKDDLTKVIEQEVLSEDAALCIQALNKEFTKVNIIVEGFFYKNIYKFAQQNFPVQEFA